MLSNRTYIPTTKLIVISYTVPKLVTYISFDLLPIPSSIVSRPDEIVRSALWILSACFSFGRQTKKKLIFIISRVIFLVLVLVINSRVLWVWFLFLAGSSFLHLKMVFLKVKINIIIIIIVIRLIGTWEMKRIRRWQRGVDSNLQRLPFVY